MAPELEIVEGPESWQVLDRRGVLLTSAQTQGEALSFLAGYRCGWGDAGARMRPSADRIAAVGRS